MLVVAGSLVYANGLSGPFVFDDHAAIVDNPSIRSPWTFGRAETDRQTALSGRPVVTFGFAVNYAIGGLEVAGYHVANVSIHLLCALALFGVVRRTLLAPGLAGSWRRSATGAAFGSAFSYFERSSPSTPS